MKASFVPFAIAATTLLVPAAARADSAFNNLGTSITYNSGAGYDIASMGVFPFSQHTAFRFTSGTTGRLYQIDLALGVVGGYEGDVSVSIWDNGGPSSLGPMLGSWDLTASNASGACCDLTSVTTLSGPLLTTGTSYILMVTPSPISRTWVIWNTASGSGDIFNLLAGQLLSVSAGALPGARLSVDGPPATRVPEPSSLVTLSSMLLLLSLGLSHRKRTDPAFRRPQ